MTAFGTMVGLTAGLGVLSSLAVATPAIAGSGSRGGETAIGSGVRQLITVTAVSHRSTYASLIAYRRASGRWVRVFGPWRSRVGYNGIARAGAKREGDGRTPAGTYGLGFFFGVLRDPGVAFPYRRARSFDVWDDDPSSPRYNEWVDRRRLDPGRNPEPMDQQPAYDYAAVIRYNVARVPGLGSAIFLHVGTGSATAGCVSLPPHELLAILRWLRPSRSPRIMIGVAAGTRGG
jgi:L,D-peptidoglycan transpeptidase YkuD (ErfK/YbiS/YcfS/YnhG family)